MKLIYEPSVYLNTSTICRAGGDAFFLDHGIGDWQTDAYGWGECAVEMAGRLCYMSFKNPRPGGNKAYVEHILEQGHGSVLEHAHFGFIFAGVSRSLTHELIRHRAGFGYSELSQRYVDPGDEIAFVVPPLLCEDVKRWDEKSEEELLKEGAALKENYQGASQFTLAMASSVIEYGVMVQSLESRPDIQAIADKTLRRKRVREAARSVLPNATETKIFVTGNARAWRHFIEMRASEAADAEIRRLAVAVLKVLQTEAPNIFGDYVIEPLADGFGETASTKWRKV